MIIEAEYMQRPALQNYQRKVGDISWNCQHRSILLSQATFKKIESKWKI